MEAPIFEFKGYSISNLIYSKSKIEGMEFTDPDENVEFDASLGFTEDFSKGKLGLKVQLASKDNDSFLILDVDGFFDINIGLLKDDEGNERDISDVHQIFMANATAILYPYLRSIVSVVTGLDNSNNIILPTINLRNFTSETKTPE
jgi:preprotein translocase subunit SecB